MSGVKISLDVAATAKRLRASAALVQRKISLDIWADLLATTPVDTGRARAGWHMGPTVTNSVPAQVQKPQGWQQGDAPYYPEPRVADVSGNITVIYNNVEYIVRLNAGHSKQAPAMFVEAAVGRNTGILNG